MGRWQRQDIDVISPGTGEKLAGQTLADAGDAKTRSMMNLSMIGALGIYDETLIDEVPAGEFRFGRHVFEHLQQREGVALSALHSTDSVRDAATAQAAGFTVAGHLEFGRDVKLPDGSSGRTKTTLALLPDPDFPRLSFFLCQQHRPELIYVPQWLEHPNSVNGISGVTILAKAAQHQALKTRLTGIYGNTSPLTGGFSVQTANGQISVQTLDAIEAEFGYLPSDIADSETPSIVAIDLSYQNPRAFDVCIKKSDMDLKITASGCYATQMEDTANVILRFGKGKVWSVSQPKSNCRTTTPPSVLSKHLASPPPDLILGRIVLAAVGINRQFSLCIGVEEFMQSQ